MTLDQLPKVAVLVDNVDPDNLACVKAAASSMLGMDLVAVFVAGRPANRNPDAAHDDRDPAYTALTLRRNAARMKGFMKRNGLGKVPVFETQAAPHTLVPHAAHIDEAVLDLHNDMGNPYMQPDGSFVDGIQHLAAQDGPIHLIVGGPLTDVAFLLASMTEIASLRGKLGTITAQLGMLGFGNVATYGGGNRQFNLACDPVAAHTVLKEYEGPIYLVSTDTTKSPSISLRNPDELQALNVCPELVEVYRRAFPIMMEPRKERISVHDLGATFLMAQLLAGRWAGQLGLEMYDISAFTVEHVPHTEAERERWGEIDYTWGASPEGGSLRYAVRGQNGLLYRNMLASTLTNAKLHGQHYYVEIVKPNPHYNPNGPYQGQKEHRYTVCMKGGHSICSHGWPKAVYGCDRNGREILGVNPEHAQRDGWAYHLEKGEWVPAFDHDIPLGSCCKSC